MERKAYSQQTVFSGSHYSRSMLQNEADSDSLCRYIGDTSAYNGAVRIYTEKSFPNGLTRKLAGTITKSLLGLYKSQQCCCRHF